MKCNNKSKIHNSQLSTISYNIILVVKNYFEFLQRAKSIPFKITTKNGTQLTRSTIIEAKTFLKNEKLMSINVRRPP